MPLRLVIILASFLLTILLYVDRAVISVAKHDITTDLALTSEQFGWVLAAFTLGYALAQAPSGAWVDRKGARVVISSIVTIWSLLTAITGMAWNFISLLVIRFLFGAGEAGAFPALSKVALNWFPIKERGIVQGINFSGSRLGAACAMPVMVFLIGELGWRHTFLLFGVIGLVFAGLWYFWFRNTPEEIKRISDTEKNYILQNRQAISTTATAKLPYNKIISNTNVQLAMLQYMCSNFTFYFTLTWMFPFIQERFQLPALQASFFSSIPFIAGFFGNLVAGLWVDALYRQGKTAMSRRLPAIVGFVLAATGMVMVTLSDNPWIAIAFLAIAVFGADMTLSPSWAFCIDIGQKNSGVVSGTMNMAGNLGGFAVAIAYPYLFKWTGSSVPFFYIAAGLSLVAILVWLMMQPNKTIESKS